MMKRSILMLALVLAGSDAYAMKHMGAGAELALRRDADAKIKAIDALSKRTPAASIRDLEAAIDAAQEAINKLPVMQAGLQGNLDNASSKALHPILRAHAAGNDALLNEIRNNMLNVILLLVGSANKATIQIRYTDAAGAIISKSYKDVAGYAADNQIWPQLMATLPAYAKDRAKKMDAIIEDWVSQISKDETAKLKTTNPAKFNDVQSSLKQFYTQAVKSFIAPIDAMTDAAKQAEFRKAIKPLHDKIEEFKREATKKGFTL